MVPMIQVEGEGGKKRAVSVRVIEVRCEDTVWVESDAL
jgi:hypothetical protein